MIEMIKEMGIFIVVAQALLYFVPGNSYVKYVKVVIGIAMIAKIAEAVLLPFSGNALEDGLDEILDQSFTFMEAEGESMEGAADEENKAAILKGLNDEIRLRLNEAPFNGFAVEEVSLRENSSGELQGISVTVSESSGRNPEIKIEKIPAGTDEEDKETSQTEEKLKKHYGDVLGIPPEQIEIRLK